MEPDKYDLKNGDYVVIHNGVVIDHYAASHKAARLAKERRVHLKIGAVAQIKVQDYQSLKQTCICGDNVVADYGSEHKEDCPHFVPF